MTSRTMILVEQIKRQMEENERARIKLVGKHSIPDSALSLLYFHPTGLIVVSALTSAQGRYGSNRVPLDAINA